MNLFWMAMRSSQVVQSCCIPVFLRKSDECLCKALGICYTHPAQKHQFHNLWQCSVKYNKAFRNDCTNAVLCFGKSHRCALLQRQMQQGQKTDESQAGWQGTDSYVGLAGKAVTPRCWPSASTAGRMSSTPRAPEHEPAQGPKWLRPFQVPLGIFEAIMFWHSNALYTQWMLFFVVLGFLLVVSFLLFQHDVLS